VPKVLDVSLLDEIVRVTSHDAVTMARRLATVRRLASGLDICLRCALRNPG
jgi:cysteine synthase